MRCLLLALLISTPALSQDAVHVFTSNFVRIAEQGERFESGTASPAQIVLNLVDSTITIEPGLQRASDYLEGQTQFKIVDQIGYNSSSQFFLTESHHIVAFYYMMQAIAVRKRGLNVKMNSLWFEQIEYRK